MNDKQFTDFWMCFDTLRNLGLQMIAIPRKEEPKIREAINKRYEMPKDSPLYFLGIEILFI